MPCCLYKGPLKRDFLNIYLTRFLESVNLEIQKLWGSFSFSKCLKFKLDLKNASKNWEKVFSFWDNCIWIDIVKLSLLRTGYFSLAANVLTSSTKIWHVNKRDFFQLNWIGSDKWIWSKCCEAVSKVPGNLYRAACPRVLWIGTFYTFIWLRFRSAEFRKWKVCEGHLFFSKCLKFKLDFKNAAKSWEKVFSFPDNCIWIGVKKQYQDLAC